MFAMLLLGWVAGCQSSSRAEPQTAESSQGTTSAAIRVTAAPPARKTLRVESVQPGQIEAFERTPLFAKLPAYVEKLYVDIGDRVEPNQVLVDLWIPELDDELRQKEAQVVQAQAGVEQSAAAIRAAEAAVTTAQAKIAEAEAGNVRAEGDYARWKSQSARISELAAGGSVDRKLADENLDMLKAAEAARGEARAKVESAKAALAERKADVAKAKAEAAFARARLENARADLAREQALLQYRQIRAPYAGVMTERNVVRGDFVQPPGAPTARPLGAVARTDIVRVFVDVPEMESPGVEAGRPASVSVQALPDQRVEGRVTRTSWLLGANRTLRTELDFPNPNGLLRPGMYATAHIVLRERRDVLTIPLAAVIKEVNESFCCCVVNGHVARRPIQLGLQVAEDVEVLAGLTANDVVVQGQAASLQDGQPVEVTLAR